MRTCSQIHSKWRRGRALGVEAVAPFFDEYYIWPFPISARSLTHYIHMRAGKEPSGAEVSQELISSLTRRTNGGARIAKEARREIAPQETIAPSEPPICHVAHISHVSGRHKMSRSKKISKKAGRASFGLVPPRGERACPLAWRWPHVSRLMSAHAS